MLTLNKKISILLTLVLAAAFAIAAMIPISVLAQCSDCWNTPTPTATPGTPTPYPVPPSSTVYATPPPTSLLPGPNSFPMPTTIPIFVFPTLPSPIELDPISTPEPLALTPIPTPDYSGTVTSTLDLHPISSTVSISYSSDITSAVDLLPISSTISLSYTAAMTPDFSTISDTAAYTTISNIIGAGSGWISSVVSYTDWISGEASTLQETGTFTIAAAPAWYAPDLPRPMANVGWTIEELQTGIDSGERYSLTTWAWFAGYLASLPVQLGKVTFQVFQFLGPLGLFVTWLFVMLPYKLWVKLLIFIKNLFIALFNFVVDLLRFLLELIGLFF